MSRLRPILILLLAVSTIAMSGCAKNSNVIEIDSKEPLVVATSAIVAELTKRLGGDTIRVELLVPNGFDSHIYEPKPSELALLSKADMVVMPDETLNAVITGLVKLSGESSRIVDLNASSLTQTDYIYRESGNNSSLNPHTWTSPILVAKWLPVLAEEIIALNPSKVIEVENNLKIMLEELDTLDSEIRIALDKIKSENRKLIVYHDAWVYFGQEYKIPVIGAIQVASFAEPSASELVAMAKQIRDEKVPAFFGSEVFPSDVLKALEKETGSRYIPDLADDRLPGKVGDASYSYISMMRANLALLLEGLAS